MDPHFTCSCGQDFPEPTALPDICPNCGKSFLVTAFEPVKPLAESAPAHIMAWGCLMPLGFLTLLVAVSKLIANDALRAVTLFASGSVLLAGFFWLLSKQKYSLRGYLGIAGVMLALFSLMTWNMSRGEQFQGELNDRFAAYLKIISFSFPSAASSGRPRGKFLPISLNPRGEQPTPSMWKPVVYSELYQILPSAMRAEKPEEVRTLILVNWSYEKTGTYRQSDTLKALMADVYTGHCTVEFVDLESNKRAFVHVLTPPDQAPKRRSGTDVTDWYGPQPSDQDVLDYVKSICGSKSEP